MHYQRLLSLVYNAPLLISEAAFWGIHRLIESRILGVDLRDRTANDCGEEVKLPSMTVENGIAHIPIGGAVGRGLGNYAKLSGAVDMADVEADIVEAEADPAVNAILFDIDSPGGTANGTPELAGRIAEIQKPKYAFSAGTMASAAYYMAAATDGIFLTPSAHAGSIGAMGVFLDSSKAVQADGLQVQVFKDGKYKGMGVPGTSLTKTQADYLQASVEAIGAEFKDFVRGRRPDVTDETMQGQMFSAKAAMAAGLIDGVVKSKTDLVSQLFAPF